MPVKLYCKYFCSHQQKAVSWDPPGWLAQQNQCTCLDGGGCALAGSSSGTLAPQITWILSWPLPFFQHPLCRSQPPVRQNGFGCEFIYCCMRHTGYTQNWISLLLEGRGLIHHLYSKRHVLFLVWKLWKIPALSFTEHTLLSKRLESHFISLCFTKQMENRCSKSTETSGNIDGIAQRNQAILLFFYSNKLEIFGMISFILQHSLKSLKFSFNFLKHSSGILQGSWRTLQTSSLGSIRSS